MPALRISPSAAREFLLTAQGLSPQFTDVSTALTHLGYVQIDPLNICGRMHDLILRNRVAGYREGDLTRVLHGAARDPELAGSGDLPGVEPYRRTAFEHHHPERHILVAFPLEAWPHLLATMRSRARNRSAWSGRLTPQERAIAPDLLEEIRRRGPLGSEDFADRRKARRVVWGAATLVKNTLQKLFFHGQLLIAARSNGRRRYDLPERVLPPETLALPERSAKDTARWLALLRLRQRRLTLLKREELRAVGDEVCEITVPDCPPLYCLKEDVAQLEQGKGVDEHATNGVGETATWLLAPLDPIIYDRRITQALWGFDYTWEAYTPAAKRVRGHYALPVLVGTELVGHVEPKADRAEGKLRVSSRSVRRGIRVSAALDDLADWLGLRR